MSLGRADPITRNEYGSVEGKGPTACDGGGAVRVCAAAGRLRHRPGTTGGRPAWLGSQFGAVTVCLLVDLVRLRLGRPDDEQIVLYGVTGNAVRGAVAAPRVDPDAVRTRSLRCEEGKIRGVGHHARDAQGAGRCFDAVVDDLVPRVGIHLCGGMPTHLDADVHRARADAGADDGLPGPGEDQTVRRVEPQGARLSESVSSKVW